MPQFKFYQVDYISHNALVSPCLENTLKFKALGLKQPRAKSLCRLYAAQPRLRSHDDPRRLPIFRLGGEFWEM